MAKVLSQEEVNALLNEFSGEEEAAAAGKAGEKRTDVSIFNFRRPDWFADQWVPALHQLYRRFTGNVSATLSAYLRTAIDVVLFSVERQTYSEFISTLGDPSYFNTVSMEPLEGAAVLEIEPRILFPMIDRLLGGKGESFTVQRTVTAIEQTLIEEVVKRLLEDLETAWRQVTPLKMSITAAETSPQFLRAAAPNENVLLTLFELTIGETRGFIKLCLPASLLSPIAGYFSREQGHAQPGNGSAQDVKKIKAILLAAKMKLDAGIYGNSITLANLLKLEPGAVIRLGSTPADEIQVCVNGVKKYSARQVKHDRKKAVQVVNLIPREFKND